MTVKLGRALDADFHLSLLDFLHRLSLSENPKQVTPCFYLYRLGRSWDIFSNVSPGASYRL